MSTLVRNGAGAAALSVLLRPSRGKPVSPLCIFSHFSHTGDRYVEVSPDDRVLPTLPKTAPSKVQRRVTP